MYMHYIHVYMYMHLYLCISNFMQLDIFDKHISKYLSSLQHIFVIYIDNIHKCVYISVLCRVGKPQCLLAHVNFSVMLCSRIFLLKFFYRDQTLSRYELVLRMYEAINRTDCNWQINV